MVFLFWEFQLYGFSGKSTYQIHVLLINFTLIFTRSIFRLCGSCELRFILVRTCIFVATHDRAGWCATRPDGVLQGRRLYATPKKTKYLIGGIVEKFLNTILRSYPNKFQIPCTPLQFKPVAACNKKT